MIKVHGSKTDTHIVASLIKKTNIADCKNITKIDSIMVNEKNSPFDSMRLYVHHHQLMMLANNVVRRLKLPISLYAMIFIACVTNVAMAQSQQSKMDSVLTLNYTNSQTVNLDQYLYYYLVDGDKLTNTEVINLPKTSFVSNSQSSRTNVLGQSIIYRLDIHNPEQTTERILQIDNPLINTIDLYVVKNGNLIYEENLGDTKQSQHKLKNSLPHFAIEFERDELTSVFLQVRSTGTTITPITLHDNQSFTKDVYQRFVTWGAFIGIILMMMAYNAFLYFGIRDKIYLFYLGYIVSIALQLGILNGFGFHIMPFGLQAMFNSNIVVMNYIISIFAILFALHFLRYDIHKSSLYRHSIIFCAILAFLGFVSFFLPEYIGAKIYYPLQLIIYVLIGRICIPKLFSGSHWTSTYLLSWLPLFVGTTVAQLVLLDIVPYNYFTQNALLYGVVLEIIFISLALAQRFRYNENERLYSVTHDSVTNLPNGILLHECTNQQIMQNQPFTLVLFQAERFSEIKPALGLVAANNLITAIVDNVSEYFQQMDNLFIFEAFEDQQISLSRIDDDTFGLIIQGAHQHEELNYIALTIQEAVSTPINVGGYNISTPCAVGIISFPQYGINADILIQKAKHALGCARKEDVKYSFYDGEQNAHIQEQLQLAADLQKAIDDDRLEMYHQPQIDLSTGSVCGNEALIRWTHPTRGFISPEIFIPLAEDTGMITQLTEWVISRSLLQHKQLCDLGFAHHISINLSAKDLTQPGLIAHIMTTIADLDLNPKTIIFELTESATSDDPVHALKTINQLHELELKVAIDDFGTGYSSLEYLSKLPFHELKIDKSFVLDIINSQRDQAITKTTVEMAKNLGLFVVAEGVETTQIEALLKSYGCELGQGYLYSKPLAIDDYVKWLQSGNQYVVNCEKTTNAHTSVLAKAEATS